MMVENKDKVVTQQVDRVEEPSNASAVPVSPNLATPRDLKSGPGLGQTLPPTTIVASAETKSPRKPYQKRQGRQNNWRGHKREQEFEEKVVDIARVTNVVKGGRRFSFSVLVVIGDKKGRVGYGHGKAKEVPGAIKKAIKAARRNLIRVPIVDNRTIPHVTQAKFGASEVLLKLAPKGRGIIASGAVRSVVELAGYQDIVTKSLRSSNKTNVVKATLKALQALKTAKDIANLRST